MAFLHIGHLKKKVINCNAELAVAASYACSVTVEIGSVFSSAFWIYVQSDTTIRDFRGIYAVPNSE